MAAVSGATSSATSRATRLSGIVSDSPTHSGPRPATNPGRPASSTAYRPYSHPDRPSSAYAAVCSTGDRECSIGMPSTAARCVTSAAAGVVAPVRGSGSGPDERLGHRASMTAAGRSTRRPVPGRGDRW